MPTSPQNKIATMRFGFMQIEAWAMYEVQVLYEFSLNSWLNIHFSKDELILKEWTPKLNIK